MSAVPVLSAVSVVNVASAVNAVNVVPVLSLPQSKISDYKTPMDESPYIPPYGCILRGCTRIFLICWGGKVIFSKHYLHLHSLIRNFELRS